MAQVKIYGLRTTLDRLRPSLSEQDCGIQPRDIEITIFETPQQNWGIQGQPGDELALSYQVNV